MYLYDGQRGNKLNLYDLQTHFMFRIEEVMQQVRHRHIDLDEGFGQIRQLISNDN